MAKNCFVDHGYSPNEQMEMFGGSNVDDPQLINKVEQALLDKADLKRQKKMQAIKLHEILTKIDKSEMGRDTGAKAFLTREKFGSQGIISAEQKANVVLSFLHSKLAGFIEANKASMGKSGRRMLGFEVDQKGMKNVVRELKAPGSTGDDMAQAHAKSLADVFETARLMFNRAGGSIKRLKNWDLPQRHDAIKVGKVSPEQWIKRIMPLLDRKAMISEVTKVPYTDSELEAILKEVYKSIVTEGAYKIEAGKLPKSVSAKIANRHKEARLLHFADAEGWLKYQEEFGAPDIFSSVMDHLHQMSVEIGAMQVLGPNPDLMVRYMADYVKKQDALDKIAGKKKSVGSKLRAVASPSLDAIYQNVMGRTSIVHNDMANRFSSFRNWNVASHLGGAGLTAQSDHGFMAMGARLNDLEVTRIYTRYLRGLNPKNAEHRKIGTRIGIVADYAQDRAISAHRYSEVIGHGATANMSDLSVRLSGLNAHTNAMKQAFSMEYQAKLADEIHLPWERLSKKRKAAFARYGIDEADWDYIRTQTPYSIEGEKFVDPTLFDDFDRMSKTLAMVQSEMKLAVLEPDAFDRAFLNRGTVSGTVIGEINRTTLQFKSFPTAVIINILARGFMDQQMAGMNRTGYLGGVLALTTILGGMVIQAKNIAAGNDMEDMDTKFWWKAFDQGGGGGTLASFFTADLERMGYDPFGAIGGPTGGLAKDVINSVILYPAQVGLGMYDKSIGDIRSRYGDAVADTFQRHMPFNNLVYLRLVAERALFDHVHKLADDQWAQRERRKLRKMERQRGQSQWWEAGELAPSRAPELPDRVTVPFTGIEVKKEESAWQPDF